MSAAGMGGRQCEGEGMSKKQNFIIVGGGLAGVSAAEELRAQGFEGRIRIYAAEPHAPYIRPPLSKGFLAGNDGLDAVYAHPDEWYAENDIEVETGTKVFGVDSAARE